MLRSLNELTGYQLQGIDDSIGRCKDFLFDDRRWVVRYMVADTHKWLPGGRKVLISPISLGEPDWQQHRFPILLSREGIENSPPLADHKPVSQQYETELFNYYGYSYYWMGGDIWGSFSNPAPLIEIEAEKPDVSASSAKASSTKERHLRSAVEVKGYDIQAADESIGHVEDFVLDDDRWTIAFIAVDTRNWLPGGRKVMIATDSLQSVSWADRSVSVNLTAQQIKDSPEYDPEKYRDPEYENVMHNLHGASEN